MIKIRPSPIFSTLFALFLLTQAMFAVDVNWLNLVRQRLDLEQKSPEALIQNETSHSTKQILDDAVVLYHKAFEQFYETIKPAFDVCKPKEWCDLKNYIEASKEALDQEYSDLYRYQCRRSIRPGLDFEYDDCISRYHLKVKHYYNSIMDVLQKIIIDGQAKEVKLFRASIKEKRQEKLQEKYSSDPDILQDET